MESFEAGGKMFRYDMGKWGGIVSFDRRKRNHFIRTLKVVLLEVLALFIVICICMLE